MLFVVRGSILHRITPQLLCILLLSVLVVAFHGQLLHHKITLTAVPFSLVGVALAIFLGFRNSASYSRFVEARNLWGTVLIAERTLVRQLRNILPAEHDAHRRIVSYLVAFSWSLKHQLRKTDPTADLRRLLPEERVTEILASSMPTNRILLLAGNFMEPSSIMLIFAPMPNSMPLAPPPVLSRYSAARLPTSIIRTAPGIRCGWNPLSVPIAAKKINTRCICNPAIRTNVCIPNCALARRFATPMQWQEESRCT